jgi:hypothetical protein
MSVIVLPTARFRVGHIITTPNALTRLSNEDILAGIRRHQAGDWGQGDGVANERALREGARLWSVYRSAAGAVFWIITEESRRFTTVLLPEDY